MPAEPAHHDHHHAHGPANRGRRVLRTAAPLFVRFPRTRLRTAVVVLHDAYGLTEPIEHCCRALARNGHVAVAPYLYYETGGKEFRPENEETARAAMSSLAADDLAADIAGALDHLASRLGIPARATGALGVGETGPLATRAAAEHDLAAAVECDPLDESPAADPARAIRLLDARMP
ncbi:dienelactone hydrolase family protein [Saccharopolyspora shandongensis]|uniref:dienelactone hydrolase family protein n=1 Tax=Saccharopolyspora shandongensis TaxID=418495 RepID=UPI0033CA4355